MADQDGTVWWHVRRKTRDDSLMSWEVRTGQVTAVALPDDLLESRPESGKLSLFAAGVIGDDDLIYFAGWSPQGVLPYRTSGREAPWRLATVEATSPVAELIVGTPQQRPESSDCLSLYATSKAIPRWTWCFTRKGEPAEIVDVEFTPDGRRLVLLARGGRWVGPEAMFHQGRDTLLVLDVRDGEVLSRLDHNFGRISVEDGHHVLFVRHQAADLIAQGTTGIGPYRSRIMRCHFDGRCEHATRPITANTFAAEVRVLSTSQ